MFINWNKIPLWSSAAAALLLCCCFCFNNVSFAQEHPKVIVKIPDSIVSTDDTNMGIGAQASRALLKAFNEKYPWIEMKPVSILSIQDVSTEAGQLMAIAGGTSPDIIYVNFRQSDSFIQQGFLYPLDEFIDKMSKQELDRCVLPPVRPVLDRVGPDHKKHWWAFPSLTCCEVLYYRKDLFHEAGLDPEKPPQTWAEMLEDCRKITNPEKGTYGLGMYGGLAASWSFYPFLLSTGSRVLQEDQQGNWKAIYNTPAAAEAVHFYAELMQGDFVRNGKTIHGAAMRDVNFGTPWSQGKIGMVLNYVTDQMMSSADPQLVGIAAVPKGPTGVRGNEINAASLGIFAGTQDPQVRDAAWKFIEFYCGPEGKRITDRVYVENGYGAYLNPSELRAFGYKEYLTRVPKGWEKIYKESVLSGVPEPYGKNCNQVYWYLTEPLDQALVENLGNQEPGAAKKRILELLNVAVAKTNEKMIGIIAPEKERFRRQVAFVVAAVIVLTFCLAFWYLMKIFTPEGVKSSWGFKKYWAAYLLLVPGVLGMAVWNYLPTLRGALIAFMNYRIMGGSAFVGLDNFANVLFDPVFWDTLGHSLYYAFISLVLGFCAPIILGLMLHEIPRGKVFFRIIFYLPAVVSTIVVVFLWKSFYDPSPYGLLNQLLRIFSFGLISNQGWLTDPKWAMLSVVIPIVWAGMGAGSLLYLAALKTVPEELYEAAEVDGANVWQKMWSVTFPTIKPLIIISFVGAFIGAFRASDFILAMTGGGPAGATKVLDLQIYYSAFMYLQFGPATAMAWILGFLLIGFTVYQMRRLSNMQFRSAGDEGKGK